MSNPRAALKAIARQAMQERGFEPAFSPAAATEVQQLSEGAVRAAQGRRDLRHLRWCSIDNDDSRDLDQLSVAEVRGSETAILVAIADVDALVTRDSAIDRHAHANTTSVYTPAEVFPMLPERLSTDLTSLNEDADRAAVVVDMTMSDGVIRTSEVYLATVRNHAKLAYPSVGAWLEGQGPPPEKLSAVAGLADNLRRQDEAARALKESRHRRGALTLDTIEGRAIFDGDTVRDVAAQRRTRAAELIEDFMIAVNTCTAQFLEARGRPSLRRIVRMPERWPRIVALAAETGTQLPPAPDAQALERFLLERRRSDPDRFADLSLSVVKLLGRGEYVVEQPNEPTPDHFGLAVDDYSHSTAPNRRYADLVTQRLIKAALEGREAPYTFEALGEIAARCMEREDAANRVERQVRKAAAAMVLQHRVGETFDAVVTGVSPKGTWVRLTRPIVEGKLVQHGHGGVQVGDRVRVKLIHVDVQKGFIDFAA